TAAPVAGGIGLSGVLGPTGAIGAGTYALEVSGKVIGLGSGSYSGGFSLLPVPLPASGLLFVAGLPLLGLLARRRG
ncbi:MAG TPA: hypothetical protein VMB75_05940, partial [Rhodocyclaceae bacterium]|nr:hypothetical protein [Rhodocyclaceae bacterium]